MPSDPSTPEAAAPDTGARLGRVDPQRWRDVPHVSGRLATEADVAAGRALFVLDAPAERCAPVSMALPACGVQSLEDGTERPVIVIQAERLGDDTLYGLRYLPGGGSVCLAAEVRLVDGPKDWVPG